MGQDRRDTPTTGTAIPRRPRSVDELYKLIEERLTPEIVERISTTPPPESRPSMPVRAAKATGRYGKGFMAITGGIMLLLQGVAWFEEYRGPIQQGVVIAGKALDLWEASKLPDDPPPAPPVPVEPSTRSMPPAPEPPDAGAPE